MTSIMLLVAVALAGVAATPQPSAGEIGGELRVAQPRAAQPPNQPGTRSDEIAMPVREVTVFSDRARVVRGTELNLRPGTRRLRLPVLPPTVDPGSIRFEAREARVQRIEVRRANLGELPRGEAEALLRSLAAVGDEERALLERRAVIEGERELLLELRPASSPLPSPEGPPILLETAGWRAALAFFEARAAACDQLMRGLDQQLREVRGRAAVLRERARQLAVASTGQPGYVIEAVVEGRGRKASLSLVYTASGARWYPSYDVRFQPGGSEVEVSFAGLVS
jgi:hypothetical protein